jgi:hypothetical protein
MNNELLEIIELDILNFTFTFSNIIGIRDKLKLYLIANYKNSYFYNVPKVITFVRRTYEF